MSQTEQLRNLVATMLLVQPGDITDGTSLASLNTSLGSAKVRLGLKRLGLALPTGVAPATFGGLVAVLSGGSAAPVAAKPVAARPAISAQGNGILAGLQVGLDVESIPSLPVAVDYWEQEFYRDTFSKAEIAYCVQQAEPRTHFAGFWCAKEALRKCDSGFAGVPPSQTTVAHDADGRPYLAMATAAGPERLPHALSISHTTEVATAVVVLSASAPPVTVVPLPTTPEPSAATIAEARRPRGLARLFGIQG
jgi:phosphopantetheine--protein transferase-like protein